MSKNNLKNDPLSVNICNIQIHRVTMDETILKIGHFIDKKINSIIVTPNVDHVIKLQKDMVFKEIYDQASIRIPDGMPLIWASRFLKTPLKEKVSGSDLFLRLCEFASDKGYKIFLLGGKPGSAQKTSIILKRKYPNIEIVGHYCPPFGFENHVDENKKIIEMINQQNPHILFVGLGAPKQEKWIYQNIHELHSIVNIGIGATFEFISGAVKRAPLLLQRMGFEWFWRLMLEPKRLWKRYLVDDMKFFWLILKQRLKC